MTKMDDAMRQAEEANLTKVWPSVIHKQNLLLVDGEQHLYLPNSSELIDIQVQDNKIAVWYRWYQHPGNESNLKEWTFQIIATGQDHIPSNAQKQLVHLSTVQMADGALVWHVHKVINLR